jgi:hypothetical protein
MIGRLPPAGGADASGDPVCGELPPVDVTCGALPPALPPKVVGLAPVAPEVGGGGAALTVTPVTTAGAALDAGWSEGFASTSPPRLARRTRSTADASLASPDVCSGFTPVGEELAAE